MPITRSDLLMFVGGVAAGATACATYPKWKDKVSPLISGALAGVAAAYRDANAEANPPGQENPEAAAAASPSTPHSSDSPFFASA